MSYVEDCDCLPCAVQHADALFEALTTTLSNIERLSDKIGYDSAQLLMAIDKASVAYAWFCGYVDDAN